jgi:hypothetical protein
MGMVYPVSSGIWGEGKVTYGISAESVIESEEDAEASTRKENMCWFGKDVIV